MTTALIALVLSRPLPLVVLVCQQAERAGVDPVLACAVVEVESQFMPRAYRYNPGTQSTDWGLWQINDGWWPQFRGDMRMHAWMGAVILAWCMIEEHGSIARALSRYHNGGWTPKGREYAVVVIREMVWIRDEVLDRSRGIW
jgi:soluble lytic murein transglycosylase-like protein